MDIILAYAGTQKQTCNENKLPSQTFEVARMQPNRLAWGSIYSQAQASGEAPRSGMLPGFNRPQVAQCFSCTCMCTLLLCMQACMHQYAHACGGQRTTSGAAPLVSSILFFVF